MSLAAPATFSMVIFSHVHFSLWTVFLTVCVCCVQRKEGTWTSWMILWSVCLSLPVTTLCGRSPPSLTPVTSITAPVLSPGTQRKRLNLYIALLDCGIDLWRLTLWLLTFCMKQAGFMMSFVTIHCNKLWHSNISISIISILPCTMLPCVSVLSLTVTVTTLPSLVWPRRSRCLSMAQWSRTQWTSTTLLMKWPAIPKSGRGNKDRSRDTQTSLRSFNDVLAGLLISL